MSAATFPALLQAFFTDRLVQQQQASPQTIAAYRDAFRLLLRYARDHLKTWPTALTLEQLTPAFIGAFLEQLEHHRGNSARTRNARLAAIHSFFRFVALAEPAHALLCQRVLAMPSKRSDQKPIAFLTRPEIDAVLATPDRSTWRGHRDHTLLLLAVQTGLRVSELIGLRRQSVVFDTGAHVRCDGKGRKQRCTPLRPETVSALRAWCRRQPGSPDDPLFPGECGRPLSRDAVERLLARYAQRAATHCPSLRYKRVTPHVLRHTAAMELLQHGVDRSVIALWLGHESVETTQRYLHADPKLKEQALACTTPLGVRPPRYRPPDHLLAFLESL